MCIKFTIIIKKVSKINIKLLNKKSIYKQTTKHNNVMHFLVIKEISYLISNNVITSTRNYHNYKSILTKTVKNFNNLILSPKDQSKTLFQIFELGKNKNKKAI